MNFNPAELQHRLNEIIKDNVAASGWRKYSASRLTRTGAAVYMKQHGIFTRNSRQAWASVVGNCPVTEVRRFIVRENLYEEEAVEATSHFNMLVACGEALGLKAEDIVNAVPLPTTRVALHIWETLTKNRHWLIGCAAKATLEQANQPECGAISQTEGERWMRILGLTKEQVKFWIKHDELDQIHGSGAFDLVLRYLPQQQGISVEDIVTAVEDSIVAWKVFYDGIGEAADAADAAAKRAA
jgi:pyrroloquinoline quinone (PQQ) biosynthesis protein C